MDNQKFDQSNVSRVLMGVIFVLAGAMVLLGQVGILPEGLNWWALFILLPAAGMIVNVVYQYRAGASLVSMGVVLPGLIALFLTGMSISMLFGMDWNVNWGMLWPLMLILIGVGMVFGRSRRE